MKMVDADILKFAAFSALAESFNQLMRSAGNAAEMDVVTGLYYLDGFFRRYEVNWFKHINVIRSSKIVIFCICITPLQNLMLFCSVLGQIVFCFRNLLAASVFWVPDLLDGALLSGRLTCWMGSFAFRVPEVGGLIMVAGFDRCERVALWVCLRYVCSHNGTFF